MHRIWKKKLIEQVLIINNGNYLDLSTGSGDIAELLLQKAKFYNINLTCADPDGDMLIKAKNKLLNDEVSFVKTAAEKMPFLDNNFDAVTLSFGLRNFTSIEDGLVEIYRIIKQNGYLYCMEFSPNTNYKFLQPFYDKYLKILPNLGKIIAKDYDSYKYLAQSISDFPDTDSVSLLMEKIGFKKQEIISLCSGACNIYIFKKC
jgi:ubiquinone/menaquinone biosynthesis methyltransferase